MAIVLALISALVYGVSDYSGGRAARLAPVFLVSLVGQLAAMASVLVLLPILGDPIPGSSDIGWSAAAGLAGVLGVSAFYYALANGAMTVVAPVTAIVSAVLPVGVGLADGEQPGALALVGVVIAVLAVALVSGALEEHERPTSRRVLLIAVAAGIGFGLLFVFFDRTGDDAGAWPLLISQLVSIPLLATWRLANGRRPRRRRPELVDHRRDRRPPLGRRKHGLPRGGAGGSVDDRVGCDGDVPGQHGAARHRTRRRAHPPHAGVRTRPRRRRAWPRRRRPLTPFWRSASAIARAATSRTALRRPRLAGRPRRRSPRMLRITFDVPPMIV
ncbi:MAG: DMT family transporter [Ilumatobacteraceae bacterium]